MKRIIILTVAALVMSLSIPVLAAEMTSEQKDQCLLASKNCRRAVDSIQQKMTKLQNEINKCDKVYSPEEINKLEGKLKEVEDMLDKLESN